VTKGITETFSWSAKEPILPVSIVAGQYFEKKIRAGAISVDCFATEKNLASIQRNAEVVARIIEFYQKKFGELASGNDFRLVEVDDRLSGHPGMLGTIFITHRELALERPAVRELARRTASQWWNETVGVESAEDLWLVDGMSYFSAALYAGETGGPESFKSEMEAWPSSGSNSKRRAP